MSATITVAGIEIPLLGLPDSCVEEQCDVCGTTVHFQRIRFVGEQIVCFDCLKVPQIKRIVFE